MWLRNKKTGGWFEIPDDKYTENEKLKDRQIAQNSKEADTKNVKENIQQDHKKVIEELNSSKYASGTYDIQTKKPVEFNNGYQVTFCQIGDDYTDQEYAKKVAECLKLSSNGKTYAGKFEGTPEISFHFSNRDQAIAYAKANNQISIWDWEKGDQIITGGTGERKKK